MNAYLREVQIKLKPPWKGAQLYNLAIKELLRIFKEYQINYWAITRIEGDIINIVADVTTSRKPVFHDLTGFCSTKHYTPFVVLQIIPTGFGASIGGYAGDAAPSTKLIASTVDIVITHPNVVNASDFFGGQENVLYVEGFALDQFMLGHVALLQTRSHNIGLIVDKISKKQLADVLAATNAVRSVHGVNVIGYSIVNGGIGGTVKKTNAGTYDGCIENPDGLLGAAKKLIAKGASALAIVSKIKGVTSEDMFQHYAGISPNPIGRVEALISRFVSSNFLMPTAHAPIFDLGTAEEFASKFECDPRAAGEVVSKTGLPCVLMGLSKAPVILETKKLKGNYSYTKGALTIGNVAATIVPSTTMGGLPVLVSEKLGIPIISVEENTTILDVTGTKLGITNEIKATNYLEAVGTIAALKAGIDWRLIRRPIRGLPKI